MKSRTDGMIRKEKGWLQKEQAGMTTVEVILVILVLIALAMLFREAIIGFVQGLIEGLTEEGNTFLGGEAKEIIRNEATLFLGL